MRLKEKQIQKNTPRPFPAILSVISVRSLKLPDILSPLRLTPNCRNANCWSKNFTKRLNWRGNGWRQNLRSAGDTTPAIKYPKAVIPAKAGIQENTLDAGYAEYKLFNEEITDHNFPQNHHN